MRRNLNIGAVSIKQQAYFTLVRPLIEYASTVWDPYTQANIQNLEMVQRRAARYVMNRQRNTSSVSDMLQRLNWRSLERRRKDAHLCMMFKIDRRLVAISKEPTLQGAQWLSGRVLDSRPRGRGFEPHRRHCVVFLEQDTFILA